MKQVVLLLAALAAAPAFAQNAYVTNTFLHAQHKLSVEGVSRSDSANGLSVAMGYRVTPYFGVEAGYVSSDTAQLGAGGVSLEVSPRSFYGALVGTWPLSPAVSVSAKLGAAHTRTTVEIIYENMYEGWREKETSAMFGVGAAWAVSRRWAVVAEYQHLGKVVKDDATIKVSMVSVGARFSF